MIGQTLLHFKITAKLGEGGMGAVYRAKDTKLGREVAIKVLPDAFTEDPERFARFEREAHVLASLNHPNIAAIYDLAEDQGTHFLVLELAEGEDLAALLSRGPVLVDDVLPLALQIAEALEAAHEKGIVHRDLKPANVMVGADGTVKVLDFGLAKAWEPDAGDADLTRSPTLTAHMTQAGTLLGTVAYMSPEQARGKSVDRRADIWAFGCVLFEALTGRQIFQGETVTDVLAAVVNLDPEWDALPEQTPLRILDLLRRCLEKDPHLRLQHMGDARIEMGQQLERPEGAWPTALPLAAPARLGVRVLIATLATLAAAALGVTVWTWSLMRASQSSEAPATRLQISLPLDHQLVGGFASPVAVSPDGARLVLALSSGSTTGLYLRQMSAFEAEPIPGTEGARSPFFSPDGEWVGFVAKGKLQKISLRGGAPLTICNATERTLGASWGPDDFIVFSPDVASGLLRVPAGGGKPVALTRPDTAREEVGHNWPQVLPGGEGVLFTIQTTSGLDVGVLSLETARWSTLIEGGSFSQYVTGHVVYIGQGELRVVPFDPKRSDLKSSPVSVLAGVEAFTVSNTGSLVYLPAGTRATENTLVWVDRRGVVSPLTEDDPGNFTGPRMSPDGTRLAVTIGTPSGMDIWIYDLERGTRARLTVEGHINNGPIWSPDGNRVAFNSTQKGQGVYWKAADGSGEAVQLLQQTHPQLLGSWSRDGQTLVYTELNPETQADLWEVSADGEGDPSALLATPFRELGPRLSPDSRWLAYVSDESGEDEVYVQPYPGAGARWMISIDGGAEPVWSPNGSELFYRHGEQMMAVAVETEPSFRAGKPEVLFEGPFIASGLVPNFPNYDITPDGERFVMIQSEPSGAPAQLHVVLNWFEELNRLIPTD